MLKQKSSLLMKIVIFMAKLRKIDFPKRSISQKLNHINISLSLSLSLSLYIYIYIYKIDTSCKQILKAIDFVCLFVFLFFFW